MKAITGGQREKSEWETFLVCVLIPQQQSTAPEPQVGIWLHLCSATDNNMF